MGAVGAEGAAGAAGAEGQSGITGVLVRRATLSSRRLAHDAGGARAAV